MPTHDEALRALDDLDDYARMETGVDAHGPVGVLRAYIEQAKADAVDATRWRFLRDLKCCTFTLSRDDDHAINYTTAQDWIDNCHTEWFADDPPEEVQKMRDTNTIWTLQVYPNTPVGFNVWNGASIDYVVDAARSAKPGETR